MFLKTFVKNNKWWTTIIVMVLIIAGYLIFKSNKPVFLETVMVEKRNLIEVVSATGNVKPLSDLNLSFESSGQVAKVLVSVGDQVKKGQYLASLSNNDLAAALEQAKAGLKIAEANLSSLKNGSTREQIAVNESQVAKANSDLLNTQISLANSIRDAYTKSDDAIRNYIDLMFNNPRTESPTLLFQTDFQLQNDLINERVEIEGLLASLNSLIVSLNNTTNTDPAFIVANNTLSTIQKFLQNLAYAVNKLSPNATISQTTLSSWKTNISTSRASIDLSMSGLASASSQYQAALASLKIYESQLTLIKTGATSDQLNAQEATVEQAKANVSAAQANLDKSIIISPIDGVITNVDAKVGQTMQPGISAMSVISFGHYNIESFIPEADIAKIKVGNRATTTLDAYGSDIFFDTVVTKIDPGETIIENVPTYKVTFEFIDPSDVRIKSGMTTNLDILTKQRENVLALPPRSIYSFENEKFVKVPDPMNSQNTIEKKITIGVRGFDGYIEVTSGLKEGDKVLASPGL